MIANSDPWTQLTVRESTKAALAAIAKAKRWKLNVTADEVIRQYAERESIEVPSVPSDSPDQPHD